MQVKHALVFMFMFLMGACTYSITMVHTQGAAEDVVDETDSATAHVSVPVSVSGV